MAKPKVLKRLAFSDFRKEVADGKPDESFVFGLSDRDNLFLLADDDVLCQISERSKEAIVEGGVKASDLIYLLFEDDEGRQWWYAYYSDFRVVETFKAL